MGGCYDYPSVSFADSSPDKGSLGAERICRGVVRVREVFTLLRSDPSSVTAFAVTPSPRGEGFGALPRQCNGTVV